MDAKSAELASDILEYQTWFLKVPIHCEGCRRKVKKVLQRIDGVFTTTIDPQQQKVTVTGSVGVDTLIRKLIKAGKHAEIWPEKLTGKGKSSSKAKKKNERKDPESVKNHSTDKAESNLNSEKNMGVESAGNCDGKNKNKDSKNGANTVNKSPVGKETPAAEHKGGESEGSGKKKKKKASGGNGSNGSSSACTPAEAELQSPGQRMKEMNMNLSPTRQQSYSYPHPETYYPPLVYLATYNNRSYPMGGPSYYVPHAGLDQDIYQMQSSPLVSFEIFSDENANGCSIM